MWVTIAVFAVILALIWRLTGRSKGLPPGPTCYPIIGNVGHFKPLEAVQAHINLRKKYGNIYTVMIFHKPMIIVHGYENIRELLLKHGDIFSDRPKTIINGVFNKEEGLMWSSGKLWEEHATFAMTSLRKLGFGKHCLKSQIMEEVDCLMDELEKNENQPFDIKHTLDKSVSNVICLFLFGKRFDYNDAKFKRLVIYLEEMFVNTNPSSPVFIFPLLHRLPMSSFAHMENSFKKIDAFTKEMIEEHIQNFNGNIYDFIDNFLSEQRKRKDYKNSTFTDKQLIITIREIFGAGTETTSSTILWMLLFLIHYPQWQDKLWKDIDAVIGQNEPKMEDRDDLPNVEAFILEVQRYANVTPFGIPHAPKQDFSYKGYLFPKGTCVTFAMESVMTDPGIFPEPFQFKPERYLAEDGKCYGKQKEKLIPFSIGQRSCLGQSLARMELFLFLTRFLQRFEIKPENYKCLPSLEGILGLTNMPKPFKLILVKR